MAAPQKTQPAAPQGPLIELSTGSVEDTQWWADQLGRLLRPGDVIALHGELGSGKTTFIQGLAKGLGLAQEMVKSPTFVLVREYRGTVPLIHIDGYRLSGPAEAGWLDEDLLFSPHKVTVIEWAERLDGLLPADHLEVQCMHVSTNRRRILVRAIGPRSLEIAVRFSIVKLEKVPTGQGAGPDTPVPPASEETHGTAGD